MALIKYASGAAEAIRRKFDDLTSSEAEVVDGELLSGVDTVHFENARLS